MSAPTVPTGPTYISSHSADVILSDIRPIKLKIEALRSINVLLDEFLYCILAAARSLATDKLRAGLLKVLPTNLGKEALLEAEVELRAYWERTKPSGGVAAPVTDDGQNFHLQWSFELLRLKCEAYSTLNEFDENLAAETTLSERMSQNAGFAAPKPALVAPAALYLTAILEAMCEHILSNVGRVASRDSSRTTATVQDLFVALCEDEAIYGLFKSMKVYDQIESFSQSAKHHRNKSFSRTEKGSFSSAVSPQEPPPTPTKEPPPVLNSSITRLSSDGPAMASVGATMPSASNSRTSVDKPKGVKKFIPGGRHSQDESANGHKRSESTYSASSGTMVENDKFDVEDSALLQEFDDLMRSNATMKVSLTPDRLRTMEVYKRELKNKAATQGVSPGPDVESAVQPPADHPSRANGRRPSLRPVDSIVEDDEESRTSPVAPMVTPAKVPDPSASPSPRTRSASVASPIIGGDRILPRKSSHAAMSPPSSFSNTSPPTPSAPKQLRLPESDGRPPRTRKVQKNRESLDLDDIMAGSDDEASYATAPPVSKSDKLPPTPRRAIVRPGVVSASTRDLIDFLAEGPPEPISPPSMSPPMMEPSKSKGGGRLQRMMSKLTMGGEKQNKSSASADVSSPVKSPRRGLPHQPSLTNMSALANRPIPPRPHQITPQITPPESPSMRATPEGGHVSPPMSTRSRAGTTTKKPVPAWDQTEESLSRSSHAASDAKDHDPAQVASPASPVPSRLRSEDEGKKSPSRRSSLQVQRVPVPSIDPELETAAAATATATATPSQRGRPAPKSPEVLEQKPPRTSSLTNGHAHSTSHPSSPSPARSPPLPAVPVPTASPPPAPAPPAAPGIAASDADLLRKLMANATNADECRLILHTVLVKSGIPVEPLPEVPVPAAKSPPPDHDPALESTLVDLFLGNGNSEEPVADVSADSRAAVEVSSEATTTSEEVVPASETIEEAPAAAAEEAKPVVTGAPTPPPISPRRKIRNGQAVHDPQPIAVS
ncbi:hypothetical protein HGRIS_010149 [Hohenbuehelia grisea]|uniref:Uncharacterized protein n=1 Tax=Hohenbuehelia grisea TaxID=104357 RepID=A0ABR3J3F4_9AGAR